MRSAFDQAARVLQPANAWEHDRLTTKIVELVLADELDAQRLCRAVPGEMQGSFATTEGADGPVTISCVRPVPVAMQGPHDATKTIIGRPESAKRPAQHEESSN
jgi:hypothetical protein